MIDITKRDAEKIATKLEATATPGGKHMKVKIYVDGVFETSFGYSHSLRAGNHHIPDHLRISASDTRDLARCGKTQEWYFGQVRARRDPPDQPSDPASST